MATLDHPRSKSKTAADIIAEQHQSKYRHAYGFHRRELGLFKDINVSVSAQGTNACDVNGSFLAVALETSGGGSFVVMKVNQAGRVGADSPRITGHLAHVSDIKFNPFIANQIASASEDGNIRLWTIPRAGLSDSIHEPTLRLSEHTRRVSYLGWNPIAANVLASAGLDRSLRIWDTGSGVCMSRFDQFPENIHSLSWNLKGSLVASTCNDRFIRIIDPRTSKAVLRIQGHTGASKPSKALFLADDQTIFTCGFSKQGSRQMGLWDIREVSESLALDMIDTGSGLLYPHYDPDLEIVYLLGKGDGNFRYYEIIRKEPYFYYLSEFASCHPQHGFAATPKLELDHSQNEIARFYKLHGSGLCEPISILVPRRSGLFQTDLFPDTYDIRMPLMESAADWMAGGNSNGEKSKRRRTPVNQTQLPATMIDPPPQPKSNKLRRRSSSNLPFPALSPIEEAKIQTTFVPLPSHLVSGNGQTNPRAERWTIDRGVDETPFRTVQELRQELSKRTQVGSSPIMRAGRPKRDVRISEIFNNQKKEENEQRRQEKDRCVVIEHSRPSEPVVPVPHLPTMIIKRRKTIGEDSLTRIWSELAQHERRLRLLERRLSES